MKKLADNKDSPLRNFRCHLSLHRYIYGTGLWRLPRLLLLPLSWIYPAVSWLRYRLVRSQRLPFFTFAIGNLVAGGTGKTPLTLFFTQYLQAKGLKVAILARGYGGKYCTPFAVITPETSWEVGGDEPLLLALRSSATVVVSRNRLEGARYLATRDIDVVILDDAFSNHTLTKDYEIVLLDAANPYGNGWPIPSGTLREFPSQQLRADMVLLTRVPPEYAGSLPAFHFALRVDLPTGSTIACASALGNNRQFQQALQHAGYTLAKSWEGLDHQPIPAAVIAELASHGLPVVTTVKDFVKIPAHLRSLVHVAELEPIPINLHEVLTSLEKRIDLFRTQHNRNHFPAPSCSNSTCAGADAGQDRLRV